MNADFWNALPQLIVSIATFIATVGGFIVGLYKLRQVHDSTNSKMDALLALTAKDSHERGVAEQKAANAVEEVRETRQQEYE